MTLPFADSASLEPFTRARARRPETGNDEPVAISVAELDRRLKRLVEVDTANIHVEGEVSNRKEVASGHIYFTLKDELEEATIDCVMYRTAPPRSRRLLADGGRVVLIGRATVYAPRGRLQFCAEEARSGGRGVLLEALERLKEKLAAEGLFSPERKRPLPSDPKVIGVITSNSGAAIHDIVTVAFRRGPLHIVLSPAPVQGEGAAAKMVTALSLLEQVPEVEVIILGRGGGSADDLGAFNDEHLVRKVASARVPVVSAVGHEIDVTLTDLVADARAATPSQAAEMLVPDAEARAASLAHLRVRLERAMSQRLREAQSQLEQLRGELGSPEHVLAERRRMIEVFLGKLEGALRSRLTGERMELARLDRRLAARHPSAVIASARSVTGPLSVRLEAAMRRVLAEQRRRLAIEAAALDALSPLSVLGRGYAIVTDLHGRVIRDTSETAPGSEVRVRVARGILSARVVSSEPFVEPERPAPRREDG